MPWFKWKRLRYNHITIRIVNFRFLLYSCKNEREKRNKKAERSWFRELFKILVRVCKYDYNLNHFLDRLVQKRNTRMQRRRATSRNPLKVLAARTDLRSEYTEIRTNVVARTTKKSNIRKRESIFRFLSVTFYINYNIDFYSYFEL